MTAESQPGNKRLATLSNPNADRIRAVASLARRSVRRRTSRALVEGPQAVREAVRFCGRDLIDVYISEDVWDRHSDLVQVAQAATRWVHPVTAEVAHAISTDSQGVAAVVNDFRTDGLVKVDWSLICVLGGIQDPGNVGTMIRIADAAGADAVFACSGTVDPTSPKVIRASAGSVFHLPTIVNVGFDEVAQWARSRKMNILGTDAKGAVDLFSAQDGLETVDLAAPTAWVFGNEAHGYDKLNADLIDYFVSIPLQGHAESLNVSAAAAVTLFATAQQRRRINHSE